MTQSYEGYTEAARLIDHNKSPRSKRLEWLASWVDGHQYDDRDNWWNDRKPLWERAPCIVYPVTGIAISSNADLLIGEGRYPQFTTNPGENAELDDNGLNQDDSETVDRFLAEYHKLSRFKAFCRESFEAAQGCGTSIGIHGVKRGKPFADSIPANWCEAEWDADRNVSKLTIQYPYLDTYRNAAGNLACKAKLYRRVIDSEKDTTYFPADATQQGPDSVEWRADPAQTFAHGFGFCPVIWYAQLKGCAAVNEVDGKAIHANFTDEIQAHDIALSQKHRGALFSEPQIVETGVPPGYSPTSVGRKPLVPGSVQGGEISANNPPSGDYFGDSCQGQEEARKKGPGYVWQYSSPDTKVCVLTYPDGALKAQDDNARDLRMKLMESLGVVLLDPESIKFAATTSGKALETIKQRQLDRCDTYRTDFESGFLEPSIAMQLRIAQKLGVKLRVSGIAKVTAILDKFATPEGWMPPAFQIRWGDYFKPDPEDQAKIVKLVAEALTAGIITLQIAVEKVKAIFGIENVTEIVDQLKAEKAEHDAKEAKQQAQANAAKAGKSEPPEPAEPTE